MILNIRDMPVNVEYIRVFRDAVNIAFYALVNDTWVYFYKFRDKRLPTYSQVEWPNPQHMYGWSKPYQLCKEEQSLVDQPTS